MTINKIKRFSKKPVVSQENSFDFERWAQLVKPELMAALAKRNEQRKKALKA